MENITVVLLSETEKNLDKIRLYYKGNTEVRISNSVEVIDVKSKIRFSGIDLVILDKNFLARNSEKQDSLEYDYSKNVIVIQILNDRTIEHLYNSTKLPKYYLSEKLLSEVILSEAIRVAVEDEMKIH